MNETHQPLFDKDQGLLDRRVFSSEETYEQEIQRIFARCWLFVGPGGWLANPGDYLTTFMGPDNVLIWRGADGELRAFANICLSSMSLITTSDRGNAMNFQCPCHHWTYNSDGHADESPEIQLARIPRIDSYKGLVFASFDSETPALVDYLGDFTWYLDLLVDRREGGIEFVGGAIPWEFDANWKLPVEAFFGDVYREATIHASTLAVERRAPYEMGETGHQISAGAGGVAVLAEPDYSASASVLKGYEEEHRDELTARLGPVRSGQIFPVIGAIFPNLTLDWRTRSIHVWHPRSADKTEVHTFCIADVAAPPEIKQALRRNCQLRFGPAGLESQDDVIPWESITSLSRKVVTARFPLNLQMGLGHEGFHEDFPGKVSQLFSEMNQRFFYKRWQDVIDADSWAEINLDPT